MYTYHEQFGQPKFWSQDNKHCFNPHSSEQCRYHSGKDSELDDKIIPDANTTLNTISKCFKSF